VTSSTEAWRRKWPVYSPFARAHYSRGQAEAILTVLKTRKLDVSDAERERIVTCTNLNHLKTWLRRAVRAEKTSDLFS
jgi:hypothetical protein